MKVPLSQVAEINPKPDLPAHLTPDAMLDFLPMADVSEAGVVSVTAQRPLSEVRKGFTAFRKGDILIAKITPCFENNKIAVADISSEVGFGSTEFHVVRCDRSRLDSRYVLHLLRSNEVRAEGKKRMTGSAGQQRVPKKFLEDLEIPLPPLEEQKRIAAILDEADELRRKRQRSHDRLNQLGQAIFIEMFGDKIASGATTNTIGDVSERVTKGESPKWQGHSYVDDGALFVTSENVGWGELLSKEPKFVPMEFHLGKLRRSMLRRGDILINLVGASIGRACIFESEFEEANINQAVAVVTLSDGPLLSRYLLAYLLSPWGQEQILGSRVEGARANISLGDVRNFEFYMPTRDQLANFAERVTEVARSGTLTKNALAEASRLFASLQKRSFREEL